MGKGIKPGKPRIEKEEKIEAPTGNDIMGNPDISDFASEVARVMPGDNTVVCKLPYWFIERKHFYGNTLMATMHWSNVPTKQWTQEKIKEHSDKRNVVISIDKDRFMNDVMNKSGNYCQRMIRKYGGTLSYA
jgi:hypothetical protein